jgi:hypothetical protein
MKINRRIVGLLAVAGLAYAAGRFSVPSSGAWAQAEKQGSAGKQVHVDVGSPGPHHEMLDQLVGAWDGVFQVTLEPGAPPAVYSGAVNREWILGGRFVREVVKATSDEGPFEGLGYMGYDNFDRQYQSFWMDTTSTGLHVETGNYHPDRKVLHMASDGRDPVTGRVVHSWGKLDMSNPDRHVYTGYSTDPEGRTYTAVEGVLERKK